MWYKKIGNQVHATTVKPAEDGWLDEEAYIASLPPDSGEDEGEDEPQTTLEDLVEYVAMLTDIVLGGE